MPRTALAALLTVAAGLTATHAATVTSGGSDDDASPLVRFVATLEADGPPFENQRRSELRAAENALARTPVPTTECAQSLGAARHGALHAEVAVARQASGDRSGAIAAWQRALDCEPRNARYRVALAERLLTFGRLEETGAQVGRAAGLTPRQRGLEELQARFDYVAGRWPDAARRARQIAARLNSEPSTVATTVAGATVAASPRDDAEVEADAFPDSDSDTDVAGFWRLLALLAQRRGGLPPQALPDPDPTLGGRWPLPLYRLLVGETDERAVVAAIEARDDPRRRREMACEALYYTAQQAFANGRPEIGRQRLARVVNLKVLYFVEHDLALAELAMLRRPGTNPLDRSTR